jgi:multidrug resistance efflux pump
VTRSQKGAPSAPIDLTQSPSESKTEEQLRIERKRRFIRAAAHMVVWQGELEGAKTDTLAGEASLKNAQEKYKSICDSMVSAPSSENEAQAQAQAQAPRTKRRKVPTPRVNQSKRAAANAVAGLSKGKGKADELGPK